MVAVVQMLHNVLTITGGELDCRICQKNLIGLIRHLRHLQVMPRSLPSHGYSIWNPWNECWLRPQPISYSMEIMDSMWNEDGMVME